MARWKAGGRLYIHCNWTFFAISYGWDVMSRNPSKSAFFEGGLSLWAQISDGKGHHPPTTVGVRKLEWLPFRVVSKYPQSIIFVLSQYTHLTDWQTNGQNCDSNTVRCITCSHTVKTDRMTAQRPHSLDSHTLNVFHYLLRFRNCEAKCVQFGCFRRWSTSLHSYFAWTGSFPINQNWHQKTRHTGLPDGEDHILLCSLVLTQHWSVTDRQTDGFAIAYTALVALPVSMENRIKLCVNICAVAVSGESVQWGRNSGVDSTVPASAAWEFWADSVTIGQSCH